MKYTCCVIAFVFATATATAQLPAHHLQYDSLATRWDEGIPLGNGLLGALVWKKEGRLRLSLDRADLWDDRPMPGVGTFNFQWVIDKVRQRQYDSVQQVGDEPYEISPAPTKIPGAALEFNIDALGKVVSNKLNIETGRNEVRFAGGAVFTTYVHARYPFGVFTLENGPGAFIPELMAPAYVAATMAGPTNSVDGQSLERLEYASGTITKTANSIRYHQPAYGGHYYEVLVTWKQTGRTTTGAWTISNGQPAKVQAITAAIVNSHAAWWKDYWARSVVQLPEPLLEKQYYLDMYKFGCVARNNTPPISLQAVWTADNGKLPPWKGDFHHDLNTQLSYWPGYAANHTDLTGGFTNWLWNTRAENKRWTKQYFGADGLNVPGVNTITGKPMGGWIQYSMSPTTAAWLSQHFYWQWKYTNDERFLKEKCKPWFEEVAKYLDGIMVKDPATGKYMLPLSSSPEYNDNSIDAWFKGYTNYDLANIRFFYEKYAEVTGKKVTKDYPFFDTDSTGLTIAQGHPLAFSHRHHAHLMAIYPLKVLAYDHQPDRQIIDQSLQWLTRKGTRAWVGYSFPWAACLYAQTGNGDSAVSYLRKFASNFVSLNSFHLNGDQKRGQYSGFTYRPFTLEGNFAFAQGIHELLLQSRNGIIKVFPAIPSGWKEASFRQLRSEEGNTVSAILHDGRLTEVRITAGKTGKVQVEWPYAAPVNVRHTLANGVLAVDLKAGESVVLKPGS